MSENKQWITRYAYAKKWGISLPTVYKHIKMGYFPASALDRTGDKVLVDADYPMAFRKAGRRNKPRE